MLTYTKHNMHYTFREIMTKHTYTYLKKNNEKPKKKKAVSTKKQQKLSN